MLNLKDLLAVLQPRSKRVFANGSILRPHFLCRIVQNSAIFCQNPAEYGTKSTFLMTGFIRTGAKVLGLGSNPNEHRTTNWSGKAESITRAPTRICRQAVTDFTSGSASCMVRDMVKLRKLTSGDHRHFPLWITDLGGKPALQTKGLLEAVSVFGRFLGCQIVPNFTNFYQKRAANGHEGAR